MNTNLSALEVIANARHDGVDAGVAYIREFGIDDAKAYCRQMMIETPKPSNAMFGYIDGFSNAVVKAL